MLKPPAQFELQERILLVDDVPDNLSVLTGVLEPAGYEVLAAADGATALRVAERAQPDLILLDVMMPNLDGLATCRLLKEQPATENIPVIFITARGDVKGLVDGFQVGGVDYLVKPFQPAEVLSRVRTHLRLGRLTRELLEKNRALERQTAELRTEVQRRRIVEAALKDADERLDTISTLEAGRGSLAGFVGRTPQVQRIIQDIQRLHQFSNTSVLIVGESGTGKELVARAVHFGSARARAPFVPVNCVAIPNELAESLLFGHVKGAFTGAVADRKGYFELAHRGTLFLDEIGDMPVALQVKILRVLEDGQITPVGAVQAKTVDVRIIAATNADLHAQMANGRFRQDLYFRLARYRVDTPPLRERLEDVPTLAGHFLAMFAAEMGLKIPTLSPGALQVLHTYSFPGNVRELRNIIERALIESNGAAIEPGHLHLFQTEPQSSASPLRSPAKAEFAAALPLNLAEAEDLLIQRALHETNGNIADAARLLGVHRTRIYRKLAAEENGSEKHLG
jgi:DNA-binding NtrC family response regulator